MRNCKEHCCTVDVQNIKHCEGHHQVMEVSLSLLQTEADNTQKVAQKSSHKYGKLKLWGF